MRPWEWLLIAVVIIIPLFASCAGPEFLRNEADRLATELQVERAEIEQDLRSGEITPEEADARRAELNERIREALIMAGETAKDLNEEQIGRFKFGLLELLLGGSLAGALTLGARKGYRAVQQKKSQTTP